MTPQLTWTREADTLVLAGELDQDVLAPLWDARVEAMNGVTRIDLSQISRVDTGTGAAGAPCEPGKKAGQCRVAVWR